MTTDMTNEQPKYWQAAECPADEATHKKGRKHYTLSWGHQIAAPDGNGGMIFNTDIPGVVEAEDVDEAAEALGLTKYNG